MEGEKHPSDCSEIFCGLAECFTLLNFESCKMKNLSNSRLTPNSRLLRKGMTKEERRLWYDFLKKLPLTVNRQKVIGNYIVDFFCFSAKIVIELDGSQHYSEKGAASDRLRDEFLGSEGIRVLRYSNHDVNTNFDGVCADILKHLELTWDDFCGSAAKTDES